MSQFESDTYLLQCAQDPLAGWDEFEKQQREEQEEAVRMEASKTKSSAKKGRKRTNMEMASYIFSKSPFKGRKIIKLQVYDYDAGANTYNEIIKLQHVVVDPFHDEVLNLTETLITKVSRKLREE